MPEADEAMLESSVSKRSKVLVTRPLLQNQGLVEALESEGFAPVILPLLSIIPFESQASFPELTSLTQRLAEFDKVIFISTNAATIACQWFDAYWPELPMQQWFAIGSATSNTLRQQDLYGLPEINSNTLAMNSESLLALEALHHVSGEKVLVVRGCGGRETLKDELQARGAEVEYMEVYRRESVGYQAGEFQAVLGQGLDVITVSSGETLDKLEQLAIMDDRADYVHQLPLVVPSARVAKLAKQKNYNHVVVAENAGLIAMMSAIKSIN